MTVEPSRAFALVAGLEFDPAAHLYTLQGRRLPSVTQVLEAAKLVDYDGAPPERVDYKRRLGGIVHELIHSAIVDGPGPWLVGALETLAHVCDVDPDDVAGHFAGFEAFRARTEFVPIVELCERPLADPALGFAGTPDLVLEFPPPGPQAVVDVKCTYDLAPACGPQTAAYKHLLGKAGCQVSGRLALHLRRDGSYTLKDYAADNRHRDDWAAFAGALAVYQWRRNHGAI